MANTESNDPQVQLTMPLSEVVALREKVAKLEAENELLSLKVNELNEIIENRDKKPPSNRPPRKTNNWKTI